MAPKDDAIQFHRLARFFRSDRQYADDNEGVRPNRLFYCPQGLLSTLIKN